MSRQQNTDELGEQRRLWQTPYSGKQPELGWSLHMTGGWRAQFNRMCRWHDRVRLACIEDRMDFLYAFFENALHLRDWLVDSGAVGRRSLDRFFERSTVMRLCRDLAIAHKHYSNRSTKLPYAPTELREYMPRGRSLGDVSLTVLYDGRAYDAFELADDIRREWEAFIVAERPTITSIVL